MNWWGRIFSKQAALGLTLLCAMIQFAPEAEAAKRVALIIGNDSYDTLPNLNNARADAQGMAKKLRSLGFDVILKLNASRRSFGRALAEFEGKAAGADVGLVFYAGHGIQSGSRNYLISSDARIEVEEDLRLEGIGADALLTAMKNAGTDLNIVIMDACRDNPLPKRTQSAERGLTVTAAPAGIQGTAIVYSASPGQTAQDGPVGGHGVFTRELLRVLDQPGLSLEQVFKQTAVRVAGVTNNRQKPWVNSSVTGDFVFNRSGAATARQLGGGADREALFWSSIKDSRDAAMYEEFLQQFPEGQFAGLAKLKLRSLTPRQTAALSPPSVQVEEMDTSYLVVKRSNVRSGPGTDFAKISKLPPGTAVDVTGKVAGKDWYRVGLADGGQGYVWGPLLSEHKPATKLEAVSPKPDTKIAVGIHSKKRRPGDTFKDCDDCPEMVVVPKGEFRMGDLRGGSNNDEKPVHTVQIGYVLAVGRFEVTYSEWDACVAGGGCGGYRPDDLAGLRGKYPVAEVNWNDAKSYVAWLSRKTGKAYRLLSEAEWEYVARAGSDTNYSFGDDEKDLCDHGNGAAVGYPINTYSSNDSNKTCKDGYGRQSAPVGSFQANAFGLHDVHGNVKEWVEDCWQDNYNGAPTDGTARTETWIGAWISSRDCSRRVRRGGSWDIGPKELRTAKRGSTHIEGRWGDLGFRVARRLHPQQ